MDYGNLTKLIKIPPTTLLGRLKSGSQLVKIMVFHSVENEGFMTFRLSSAGNEQFNLDLYSEL